MMTHIENLPHYVYQYQLCVHLVSCTVLVALALAIGIRPAKMLGHGSRATLLISCIFVATQFPITLLRINSAFDPAFLMPHPTATYINFFWSPMCTNILIWLYLSHLVSSCKLCEFEIPLKNVSCAPHWDKLAWSVVAGIGLSYVLQDWLAPALQLDDRWLLRLLLGLALAAAPTEIIYFRAKRNEVRFFNYTWACFLGSWLFFIPKL